MILVSFCYIVLGISFYSIRQLKINRAMGTLVKDEFRVIIRKVKEIDVEESIRSIGRNRAVSELKLKREFKKNVSPYNKSKTG